MIQAFLGRCCGKLPSAHVRKSLDLEETKTSGLTARYLVADTLLQFRYDPTPYALPPSHSTSPPSHSQALSNGHPSPAFFNISFDTRVHRNLDRPSTRNIIPPSCWLCREPFCVDTPSRQLFDTVHLLLREGAVGQCERAAEELAI